MPTEESTVRKMGKGGPLRAPPSIWGERTGVARLGRRKSRPRLVRFLLLGHGRTKLLGKPLLEQVRARHAVESQLKPSKSLHTRVAIDHEVPDANAGAHVFHLQPYGTQAYGKDPCADESGACGGGHPTLLPSLTTARSRALRERGFRSTSSGLGVRGFGRIHRKIPSRTRSRKLSLTILSSREW